MVGINRNKSVSEVQSTPMDIDAVKKSFCEMAVGETVFWMPSALELSSGEYFTFPSPPESIVNKLERYASSCDVILDL